MRRVGLISSAAVATLGVLLASPWHLRTGNIPTIATLFWTALGLLTTLVNSILWMDSIADRSPRWCDLGEYHRVTSATICLTPCSCADSGHVLGWVRIVLSSPDVAPSLHRIHKARPRLLCIRDLEATSVRCYALLWLPCLAGAVVLGDPRAPL